MFKHAFCLVLVFTLAATAWAEPKSRADTLTDSLGWLIGTWEAAPATSGPEDVKTNMSFKWAAGEEVVLWEGTYASDEADWSFLATFFYDPIKGRSRVFAFNSHGQRHLGLLIESEPGRLSWKMNGVRPDGRLERFVIEFIEGPDGTVTFNIKDRSPADDPRDESASVVLRRAEASQAVPAG
jgi:hypothetical protein